MFAAGGLVCFAVRAEYLEVAELKDQFQTMTKQMEADGIWRLASKTTALRYFCDKTALLYTFVVC